MSTNIIIPKATHRKDFKEVYHDNLLRPLLADFKHRVNQLPPEGKYPLAVVRAGRKFGFFSKSKA